MIAGQRLPSGTGYSTVLADMDFETYSEAGFLWDEATGKYYAPKGATKKGLSAVGAVVYTEHPTAEVLSLAYDLKDGLGPRLWVPGAPEPVDLFGHILNGRLIEAWNCGFEYWVWTNICTPRMGWPVLPHWRLRDAAAKSRAFAWPGALGNASAVAGVANQKIKDGTRLLNKFSVPRKPTKKDPRRRIKPEDDLADAQLLYEYNIGDIKAEFDVSILCPDLNPTETEFWLCTQAMNVRGVQLDMQTIHAGVTVLDRALEAYNSELAELTRHTVQTTRTVKNPNYCRPEQVEAVRVLTGYPLTTSTEEYITEPVLVEQCVRKASEVSKLIKWLADTQGIHTRSLDADAIDELLARTDLPGPARRALEIRQLVGSAGVKKLYAMQRMASKAGRAHDLFIYHAARTGRDGGRDIQPQNLVKNGPKLYWCNQCGKPYGYKFEGCPYCGTMSALNKAAKWSHEAVEHAVKVIRTGRFEEVERIYGDALLTLSGCIRGMFTAKDGHELICSDYSSIEAVVTAVLAGEQWRIDAFNRKEDIYLVSAGRITGTTLEQYAAYAMEHGEKHPDRQKIGKPAELGLGFGGWIGAWRQFDSSDNFTDEQVKNNIMAWRQASPAIVELWGGQVRGKPWAPEHMELFGLEGTAISAVYNPGQCFTTHGITYGVKDDILFCQLPSGRFLTYHKPRLRPSTRWEGQVQLSFMGWNSNPKMGKMGWTEMSTYGGKLAENCIQATARDYMGHAVPLLERAGYPVVLRVHDELVSEVPIGYGSIEQFEQIMSTAPPWAQGWPIRAAGGWRGQRYRKD